MFQLSMKLKHLMEKKRHSLQVCCAYTCIWIACSLYKLVPKVKYLHCCQMFAINKSIIVELCMLWTLCLKSNQVIWRGWALTHLALLSTCRLSSIHGTNDIKRIHILKCQKLFAIDYLSFKSKSYNMQLQVVLYCHKKSCDVFVDITTSMNDTLILWILSFYQKALYGDLFQQNWSEENI
jgi:hypothetical protein